MLNCRCWASVQNWSAARPPPNLSPAGGVRCLATEWPRKSQRKPKSTLHVQCQGYPQLFFLPSATPLADSTRPWHWHWHWAPAPSTASAAARAPNTFSVSTFRLPFACLSHISRPIVFVIIYDYYFFVLAWAYQGRVLTIEAITAMPRPLAIRKYLALLYLSALLSSNCFYSKAALLLPLAIGNDGIDFDKSITVLVQRPVC